MTDLTVRGWGINDLGEVGDGTFDERHTPAPVVGLHDIVAIQSGSQHSVALRATGVVMVWGDNSYGELGDGSTTNQPSPQVVPGLTDVKAIAAGGLHTVALKTDGTVWAWGDNSAGELGDGTTDTPASPVQVEGLTSVVAIAAGYVTSYAIKADGSVWAWGMNSYGALGDGTTVDRATPVPMSHVSDAVAIAAGFYHALILKSDGTVLTTGFRVDSDTPAVEAEAVPGLSGIAHIGAGDFNSFAVATDGSAWGWGWNYSGEIGDGTMTDSGTPVAIAGPGLNWRPLTPVIGLPSGTYVGTQSPTVTDDDPAAVLHYTVSGLDPTESDPTVASGSTVLVDRSLTLKVRPFKAGAPPGLTASATYVLKVPAPTFSPDGGVYDSAQSVTLSTATAFATIRYTTDGSPVTTTSTVYSAPIVVDSPMRVRAVATRVGWASSDEASAAYVAPGPAVPPPTISPAAGAYPTERVISFAAVAGAAVRYTLDGSDPTEQSPLFIHGFVLDRSATVKARAFKPGSQPSTVAAAAFTILAPGTTAAPSISPAGGRFTTERIVTICGPVGATLRYTTDGTDPTTASTIIESGASITVGRAMVVKARAWQGGLAASVVRREDYVITGAIAAASDFSMVLKTDGTVWAWGSNYYGQLGDGTLENRPAVPVTPVLTGAVAIAAGDTHAVALKADGTVWAWGSNGSGESGGTPFTNRLSPHQVAGVSGIVAIAASSGNSYALKSDGTVWAWGDNSAGQLGDGTVGSPKSTPTLVQGLGGVTSIAAGSGFALAVVSHGAGAGHVWAWGWNYTGQLGDGTTNDHALPQPVAGTALVTSVSASEGWAGARTSGNALLLWGSDSSGQQANGAVTYIANFNNYVPTRAAPWVTPLEQVSVSPAYALALDQAGRVWGWGANSGCVLTVACIPHCVEGAPCAQPHTTAELIPGIVDVAMVAAGGGHAIAVTQDGQVWSWGLNSVGQLGTGDYTVHGTAYAIPGLTVADNSWLTGDPDNDGLPTWREYLLGTDPLAADTDGDGIPDAADVVTGIANVNFDTDGDGLSNARERLMGTDPNNPDTDGDGVPDGVDFYPLDPARWAPPAVDPNDHTPPVITLTYPSNARPVGGGGL
jgi:alpha-tubulin suppressor-like RCC1 family protein